MYLDHTIPPAIFAKYFGISGNVDKTGYAAHMQEMANVCTYVLQDSEEEVIFGDLGRDGGIILVFFVSVMRNDIPLSVLVHGPVKKQRNLER